jgi:hypothetical protein
MLPQLVNLPRARGVYCICSLGGLPAGRARWGGPVLLDVDMPYTEIGGGSLHLEDTVLITADGHELLTTAGLDLRCVPG